jgi:tripartite-type tricarboxylate transporter receptor subunit TctC
MPDIRTLACIVLSLLAAPAAAQSYPTRSITLVVGVSPGGPTDLLARALGQGLQKQLGQSVVVENRPGAVTYIGNAYVAKSTPDGHTLLVNAIGGLYGYLFVKEQFPVSKEVVAVAPVGYSPNILVTSAGFPAANLREFIAAVKANPGKFNIATQPNTALHLESLALMQQNGLDLAQIPHPAGTASIVQSLLADNVHLYIGSTGGAMPLVQAGKLKVLAIASPARYPLLPDLATAKEQGVDFESGTYFVLFAPRQTPAAVVRRLNEASAVSLAEPEIRGVVAKAGFTTPTASPEDLARVMTAQTAMFEKAARAGKIEPQ